ncbi:MAG: nucleoside deaminase [Bacteroidales bacterium]|nr:nucleoside deaminase [Bacteroidales bacterium]
MHSKYLKLAARIAGNNIENGGGPFGAVIVRDGEIISEGANKVRTENDPTAHAEIEAIRLAAGKLKSFDLSGCTLYATCEPCPMCLGAIYWARIDEVYFASDRKDASEAGFDDEFIYDELSKSPGKRKLKMNRIELSEAKAVLDKWKSMEERGMY